MDEKLVDFSSVYCLVFYPEQANATIINPNGLLKA